MKQRDYDAGGILKNNPAALVVTRLVAAIPGTQYKINDTNNI
jgi:hypothetical protein